MGSSQCECASAAQFLCVFFYMRPRWLLHCRRRARQCSKLATKELAKLTQSKILCGIALLEANLATQWVVYGSRSSEEIYVNLGVYLFKFEFDLLRLFLLTLRNMNVCSHLKSRNSGKDTVAPPEVIVEFQSRVLSLLRCFYSLMGS